MASLMESLIKVLGDEADLYQKLLELSGSKTRVIVAGDLDKLAKITDDEQDVVAKIAKNEKERISSMQDIANVLNKDVKTLKLTDLIKMLDTRQQEQKKLAENCDRLREVAGNVNRVNGQNRVLLESSLEMVQFEMNILQSSGRAPETANYTNQAGTSGDVIGLETGRFDAKQ